MNDDNTLFKFESLLIREHLNDLSNDAQKVFKEKYDELEEKDRLIILNEIAQTSRVYQENVQQEEQPTPSFQKGGIFSDRYGNNYTYDEGITTSKQPSNKKKKSTPVVKKPVTDKIKKIPARSKVSKSATKGTDFDNLGASQNAIKNLQRSLKAAGFNPGPEDGLQGKKTNAAIAQARAAGFGIYENNGTYEVLPQDTISSTDTRSDTFKFATQERAIEEKPVTQKVGELPKLDFENTPSNTIKFDSTNTVQRSSTNVEKTPDLTGNRKVNPFTDSNTTMFRDIANKVVNIKKGESKNVGSINNLGVKVTLTDTGKYMLKIDRQAPIEFRNAKDLNEYIGKKYSKDTRNFLFKNGGLKKLF